jgi:hypothetical protein
MTSEQGQNTSGTIIRGADGALYFIRQEVLEACKVTEPEMAKFCEQLVEGHGGDTTGFSLTSGPIDSVTPLQGPFALGGVRSALGQAASTIMCPGVMKDSDFRPV